jgi:ribosomal protein S27AE
MPINKPSIPNPQRAKSVVTPSGEKLVKRECVKCGGVFYVEEDDKQTRCEKCGRENDSPKGGI